MLPLQGAGGLTEPSCNIILCTHITWCGKHLFGIIKLNQLAHIKERCFIANTCSLLHIVRYNNQGIILFKLMKQLLNARC